MSNPCKRYRWTLSEAACPRAEVEDLKQFLDEHCDQWVFQLESGLKTAYCHYQIKLRLKKRQRLTQFAAVCKDAGFSKGKLSVESAGGNTFSYETKEESRVEGYGPYRDNQSKINHELEQSDPDVQFLDEHRAPWQQFIYLQIKHLHDHRHVNFVYDTQGSIGKSTFLKWLAYNKTVLIVPPFRQTKDILQYVCSSVKQHSAPKAVFIDMPRAMPKDKLAEFYAAVETIKSGFAYDGRYTAQQVLFKCPLVWVFGNVAPDLGLLSADRWFLWEIQKPILVADAQDRHLAYERMVTMSRYRRRHMFSARLATMNFFDGSWTPSEDQLRLLRSFDDYYIPIDVQHDANAVDDIPLPTPISVFSTEHFTTSTSSSVLQTSSDRSDEEEHSSSSSIYDTPEIRRQSSTTVPWAPTISMDRSWTSPKPTSTTPTPTTTTTNISSADEKAD